MPEAAVNEDGDFATWKRGIRNTTRILQNLITNPVAQANSVHFLSQ